MKYRSDISTHAARLLPMVVERSERGERGWDIYSRLLRDRIVFLGTEINDEVANVVIAQLLFLDGEDPGNDVRLYINSPGGVVTAGFALYDTIQSLHCDVATYCVGQAASMASFLLAAGARGKRHALEHARVMIHQPHGGAQGKVSDIEVQAREVLHLRATMNRLFAHHTGQPVDRIERDTERDNFMSAEQAKAYGLIDRVLAR